MNVTCDKCKGNGKVPLSAPLERTYQAVKSGLRTTDEIYRADKDKKFMGRTAINRRLGELFELGLLWRQRRGKCHFYRVIKKSDLKPPSAPNFK